MSKPKHAFVIMPIGRPDLDAIYYEAIRPVLKSPEFGLDERRVDKHNEGGLLKNEILDLLEAADLVVADLTYARPNVYLEVGYALSHHRVQEGRGKCPRLILTVRADHMEGHPRYDSNGSKVHFDLAGYDIVTWEDAADLKGKLADKVRHRLSVVRALPKPHVEAFDTTWNDAQRQAALFNESFKGFTIFHAALMPPILPRVGLDVLVKAGYAAFDRNSRGVCFAGRNRQEIMPKAVEDDTIRTVKRVDDEYEVWSVRGDGAFFRFAALEEDLHQGTKPGDLLWHDLRIWDFTLMLHFLERLYTGLEVPVGTDVHVRAEWHGLKGRTLGAATTDRKFFMRGGGPGPAESHSYMRTFAFSHAAVDIAEQVKQTMKALFLRFDFNPFPDAVYDNCIKTCTRGA